MNSAPVISQFPSKTQHLTIKYDGEELGGGSVLAEYVTEENLYKNCESCLRWYLSCLVRMI